MRFARTNFMLSDFIENLEITLKTTGDKPVVVAFDDKKAEIDEIEPYGSECVIKVRK